MRNKKKLTTSAGYPVVDNQHVMTCSTTCSQLLQEVWFLEKLAHFDRAAISERRMYAKGSGATTPLPLPTAHFMVRIKKARPERGAGFDRRGYSDFVQKYQSVHS